MGLPVDADNERLDTAQQEWRSKATQAVLLVVVAVGLPLVILGIVGWSVELPLFGRLVCVSVWAVLLATLLLRKAHYRTRAIVLLIALYSLTVTQLVVGGLVGQGRVSLVLLPVLAMVLLGLRAGWAAFLFSILLMAATSILGATGVLAHLKTLQMTDVTPQYWTFQGLNLFVPLLTVMVLLTAFVRLQTRTMAAEQQTRRELEDEIATRRQCEAEIARVSEEERRKLGSELHDSLCQELAAALLNCSALENRVAPAKGGQGVSEMVRIRESIERAIGMAYDVARDLCPVGLEAAGLVPALQSLCRKTSGFRRMACELRADDNITVRDATCALQLYRIAGEALANAVKHSSGSRVVVHLTQQNGAIELIVKDDGNGLLRGDEKGMGRRIMDFRAKLVGGSLDIAGEPGLGTTVTCRIPKPEGAA